MSFFDKLKSKFSGGQLSPDDLVRKMLMEHGDDGRKIRTVDHLAYFKTDYEAAA